MSLFWFMALRELKSNCMLLLYTRFRLNLQSIVTLSRSSLPETGAFSEFQVYGNMTVRTKLKQVFFVILHAFRNLL